MAAPAVTSPTTAAAPALVTSTTSSSNASGDLIYSGGSVQGDQESHVMSERVQQMAGAIYKEFERMIGMYSEDSVKEVMPLVVSVLDALDLAYLEKEEREVELELLREDNEQLATQYAREKSIRREAETHCLAAQDHFEGESRSLQEKVESLESIVRMLELKARNSSDHATRLEERETELKSEYQKLHERYTDLFRTHMDYTERTKFLMGNDKFDSLTASQQPGILMSRSATFRSSFRLESDEKKEGSAPATEKQDSPECPASKIAVHSEQPNNASLSYEMTQEPGFAELCPSDVESGSESGRRRGNTDSDRESVARGMSQDIQSDDGENNLAGNLVDPAEFASAVNDTFFGMGREVENLIKENTELLDMKNALNIVKNDLIARVDELSGEQHVLREEVRSLELVREKLNARVAELEEDLKKVNEELKMVRDGKDEEEDVPHAQRKRFTRVEMARVLVERNQYKERLMELQEAVRWTEMMRANKTAIEGSSAKKRGFWDFFSGLFPTSTLEAPSNPHAAFKTSVSMHAMMPGGSGGAGAMESDSEKMRRKKMQQVKNIDLFESPQQLSDKRQAERREQYKLVKAHVQKDESGRVQAYGWSIPAVDGSKQPPLPVPTFCRPLSPDKQNNLKIWTACATLLSGGRDKSGAFLPVPTDPQPSFTWPSHDHLSLLWICSSAHGHSRVALVDGTNPGAAVSAFDVSHAHLLSVACIPGVSQSDHTVEGVAALADFSREPVTGLVAAEETSGDIGRVSVVQLPQSSPSKRVTISEPGDAEKQGKMSGELTAALQGYEQVEPDTRQPCVWLGSQCGKIFVHSAVQQWSKLVGFAQLDDAVLYMRQVKGRVFVALANGKIVVFHRSKEGVWLLGGCNSIEIGKPQHAVRYLELVNDGAQLWAAYKNNVCVIDTETLALQHVFAAHPRKESQVRQLVAVGQGVWCSIRLDSTLRLYHSTTYQHLQDVDVEPYVGKMLGTSKLGFQFVRITALSASCQRLWIGTSNGIVITVPFSDSAPAGTGTANKSEGTAGPGSAVRVYEAATTSPGVMPFCSMSNAQLSFHGHKDAVKFFVSARAPPRKHAQPQQSESPNKNGDRYVVVAGGEGYIDFRVGEEAGEEAVEAGQSIASSTDSVKRELSHLLVWEVRPGSTAGPPVKTSPAKPGSATASQPKAPGTKAVSPEAKKTTAPPAAKPAQPRAK